MEAVTTIKPLIRVAALSGSLRKSSYKTGLLRAAIDLTKESVLGMQIEYIDISPLPLINTDLEINGTYPPVVEAFRQKILEADSILFASPEYNFSVSVVLDALLAVGDGTNRESGEEELDPVISLKLDKVWDLDGEDEIDVLSIIPSKEDFTGVDDCNWVDEVSDTKVKVLLKHIEEEVKFKREMLVDGFRGLAAQVTIRRSW